MGKSRRILALLFVIFLVMPFSVKAEECGEYLLNGQRRKNTYYKVYSKETPNGIYYYVNYTYDGWWIFDTDEKNIISGATSCPEVIYEYYTVAMGDSTGRTLYSVSPNEEEKETVIYQVTPTDNRLVPAESKGEEPIIINPGNKYGDLETCHDTEYEFIKGCGCMPAALTDLTSRLYTLIKIATMALLLIVGGFDLIKAMSAQDEKAIAGARKKLVNKFIAAVAVFLIFTAVQALVRILADESAADSILNCVDYLLNGYKA